MQRVHSIDIVRGLVMIIMALDHVRDLIHVDSITQSPTDLATTDGFLFFTRWITHLCAPIFVFLAGTSAWLFMTNKNSLIETKKHFVKRGFWLLLLEFSVVNFGLYFDPGFHTVLFEVIAAIGFGFIMLGIFLNTSPKTLGIIGLMIIVCHNLTVLIPFAENSIIKTVLTPLFSPTAFPLFSGKVFVMGYPPIPWLGIMFVGFGCGSFFTWPDAKRKSLFLKIGLGALLLFVVVRSINIYGDSAPWKYQNSPLFTFLSFMNITKYPPSLVFCLSTLGIMFLLLAFAEQCNSSFKKFATNYGKVPLFYFVVHFYLIHIIALAVLLFQGFQWSQFEFSTGTFGRPKGLESGLTLWSIYIIWALVVLALYKPCQWFGQYKATHRHWWLKYV